MSATDSPTQQITKTNQRLFHRYAAVFMKPESPEAFVTHAQKLSDWLGDFKAYYGAARPEIIRLLLIAHRTICTSLNVDPSTFNVSQYPNDAMVQAYGNLVRTVEPFKEYFRAEPGSFIDHIEALALTIHSPYQPSVSSNQTISSNQQHSNTETCNSGLPTSAIEHDPEVVIIPKPPNFPDHTKKETRSVSIPAMIANTTAKSTRPKAKKRKTIDFNLLVEEDIKGLVEKQAARPSNIQPDEDTAGNVFSTSTMQDALIPDKSPATTTETPVKDHIPPLDATSVASQLGSQLESEPQPPSEHQVSSESNLPSEYQQLPPESSEPTLEYQLAPESNLPSDPQPLSEHQLPPESISPSESQVPLDYQPLPEPDTLLEAQASLEHQPPPASNPLPESQHLPSEPLRPESPPGKSGSSIHVIARHEGLARQGHMTISFNIPDSTYTMISNWVKANSNPNEYIPFKSCICFSFGCYLTPDLKKNSNDAVSFEDQLESACSTWPPYGSLSMNVPFNGSQQSIPLSPPIKLTPNTLVDMCPFIICGENKIDITQKQDLSQYTFVFYAHWPSKEQLAQVRKNRKKEQDWKNWMLEVTRPFKVPAVDYSQAVQ